MNVQNSALPLMMSKYSMNHLPANTMSPMEDQRIGGLIIAS